MRNGIGLFLGIIMAFLSLVASVAPAQSQPPLVVVSPESFSLGEVHPNKAYTRSVTVINISPNTLPSVLFRLNTSFIYFDRPDSGPEYSIPFLLPGASQVVPFTLVLPDSAPVGNNDATITVLALGEVAAEAKVTFKVPIILSASAAELVLQLQQGASKSLSLLLKNLSDTGVVRNVRFSWQYNPGELSVTNFDLIKEVTSFFPSQIRDIKPLSTGENVRIQMAWEKTSRLTVGKYPVTLAILYDGLSEKEPIKVRVSIRLVPEDIDWYKKVSDLGPIEAIPGVNLQQASLAKAELRRLVDLIPEKPTADYYDVIKPNLEAGLSLWESLEKIHSGLKITQESIDSAQKALPPLADKAKRLANSVFDIKDLAIRVSMQTVTDFLAAAAKSLEEEVASAARALEAGAKAAAYQQGSLELEIAIVSFRQAIRPVAPDFTLMASRALNEQATKQFDRAIELFNRASGYLDSAVKLQQARSQRKEAGDRLEKLEKVDIPKAHSDVDENINKGDQAVAEALRALALESAVLKYREAEASFSKAADMAAIIPDARKAEQARQKRAAAEAAGKAKEAELNSTTSEANAARKAGDDFLRQARAAALLTEALRNYQLAKSNFEKARDWFAKIPDTPAQQYSEGNRAAAEAGEKEKSAQIAQTQAEADGLLKAGTADLEKAKKEALLVPSAEAAESARKGLEKARDLYATIPSPVLGKEAEDKRSEAEKWRAAKQQEVDRAAEEYKVLIADGNAAAGSAATGPMPDRQVGYNTAKGYFDLALKIATALPDPARISEAESKRQAAETGGKTMETEIASNRSEAARLAGSGRASFERAKDRFFLYIFSRKYHEAALRDLEAAVERYSRVGAREDVEKARDMQAFIPQVQARMVEEQRLQAIQLFLLLLLAGLLTTWAIRRHMEIKFVDREVEMETVLFSSPPGEGEAEQRPNL